MTKKTNRKVVTIGLLAALFVGALDATVVSTAMPRIITDLNGLKLISWIFSIYTLTTCVTTPIFGKLADLFGRRTIFVTGLTLFVLGSICCGAAATMPQLIWFRALQGIGAGALTPVTFTIIGDLYPGEQRAKVQGIFASVWSVAGLLGPLVGGYFVDALSWRGIFYMNVPVGIIAFALVFGFLHETFEKKAKSIDYFGALSFTIAVSSLLYALLNGGVTFAWSSGIIVLLFAVAIVFLGVFLWVESRVKEPMLPLSLFRNRTMALLYAMSFLGFCVTAGVSIYSPMWIQTLLGHSATGSGLTLMPMSIAWPVAANLAGRFMFRLGAKAFILTGAVIVTLGTVWLAAMQLGSPYWYFVFILIIIGFGMGCMTTRRWCSFRRPSAGSSAALQRRPVRS
ncbi:DHA2 family efflux MFS transporter permease subunit [Gordoniibacillus kamchatkensis]|uniref:DHA2 family efflux MFS transporter permease subunit n=1 Tax=Gordoniibacillus kamchatkensis TaxID=1590651 RepID=UPI000A8CC563|nr:DHA2 family efflux MFS transporter permease subunit [Paenibacillus sp. VKM B-2647]